MVTGAAGNLGRRVTASLAARPTVERVLAVDMVPMPATAPEVEAHAFDLSSPGAQDELAALAKRADVLVHLAWEPEGKQNLRALQHVLEAAEAIEPAQLVHLSSGTVYGAWPDNAVPLTEEVTPRPNAELAYAVEKRAAEELVEKWSRAHPDIAVALLRPACTVGSTEQPLYQALATSKRPPLGAEGRIVQYLHVNDLASAVVHTCEKGLSGTYNVAPDNGVREEVAGALAGGSASLPLSAPVRAALAELAVALVAARRAARSGALRRAHLGHRGRQAAFDGMAPGVQLRASLGGQRRARPLGRAPPEQASLGRTCRRCSHHAGCRRRQRHVVAPPALT